jgi:hypothetical protein
VPRESRGPHPDCTDTRRLPGRQRGSLCKAHLLIRFNSRASCRRGSVAGSGL